MYNTYACYVSSMEWLCIKNADGTVIPVFKLEPSQVREWKDSVKIANTEESSKENTHG